MPVLKSGGSCKSSQPAYSQFFDELAASSVDAVTAVHVVASEPAGRSWLHCSAHAVMSIYCQSELHVVVNCSSRASWERQHGAPKATKLTAIMQFKVITFGTDVCNFLHVNNTKTYLPPCIIVSQIWRITGLIIVSIFATDRGLPLFAALTVSEPLNLARKFGYMTLKTFLYPIVCSVFGNMNHLRTTLKCDRQTDRQT